MIREHAFNSQWWGEPTGFVYDSALFALDIAQQKQLLQEYAWAEFVAPIDSVAPDRLLRSGFFQTDMQIGFKLDMTRLPPLPDFAEVTIRSAAEQPFTIGPDDLAPFEHERFRYLPGITADKLATRYTLWANRLVAAQPEWCLALTSGGQLQGWFLSEKDESGFHLTLAALHQQAQISGMLLYQAAIAWYAQHGQRVGSARFSVTNTAVHNIYARLGARFLSPTGCWLWVRE